MKKWKSLVALWMVCMLMGVIRPVYAEDAVYTVTLHAGDYAVFSDGSNEKKINVTLSAKDVKDGGANLNDVLQPYLSELKEKTEEEGNTKGYKIQANTLRISGTENSPGTRVDRDLDLSIVYYIDGAQIDYTVKYVLYSDPSVELAESDTFSGLPGTEVIIPYKYIENYLPNAFNYSWKISEDKTELVFYYRPGEAIIGESGETIYVYYDVPGQGGQGAGGGGGGTPTPGGNEEEIPDEQTPQTNPDDVIDIDDPEPPLAPGGDGSEGDGNEGSSIFNGTTLAVAGGVGAVGIVSLFLLLAKKKKEEEEEE